MRAMVGLLRDGAEPGLAPQPGVADIERLARGDAARPRVDVRLSDGLEDLNPSVGIALYRIAQEAVTNAARHARSATRVAVDIAAEGDQVHLTVRDDGAASATGSDAPGYGLLGMRERTALLGGVLTAGPDPEGGWTVDAVLPRRGPGR
jgi:signal transduction histidine kinase